VKFKRRKIPRCPQLQIERATFTELNRMMRQARQDYRQKCYEASVGLNGKALLRFVRKTAERMKASGMYAESYMIYDNAWNTVRFFFRRETGGGSRHRRYGQWDWWLNDRGIELPSVRKYLRDAA
jgi:hypothetical protein